METTTPSDIIFQSHLPILGWASIKRSTGVITFVCDGKETKMSMLEYHLLLLGRQEEISQTLEMLKDF